MPRFPREAPPLAAATLAAATLAAATLAAATQIYVEATDVAVVTFWMGCEDLYIA